MEQVYLPGGIRRQELYAARMRTFIDEVSVYPVSCEALAAGRTDQQWLDGVLAGGARIVQLRDKTSPDHVLIEKARYFRRRTREVGALFLVNDRVDIALLADADGVHVGQNDMSSSEVREQAPDLIIGLSCNTLSQVVALGQQVQQGSSQASYYNIGPLFQTGTKQGLKDFLGVQAIAEFSRHCLLPYTVMGGIKLPHVAELCHEGARRIAVVTAISQAADITETTRQWVNEIKKYRRNADPERQQSGASF